LVHEPDRAYPLRDLLASSINSDELSEWLRKIDAGEMVLIIDACQSAASVSGGGFKPGPMGSRGLGQLAYDKGMAVLAAAQADSAALEDRRVGQDFSRSLSPRKVWRPTGPIGSPSMTRSLSSNGYATNGYAMEQSAFLLCMRSFSADRQAE